jgi:hypothetical protein
MVLMFIRELKLDMPPQKISTQLPFANLPRDIRHLTWSHHATNDLPDLLNPDTVSALRG